MEEGSITPLRASCDRCRAQKLRCVPSAKIDACERCVKAKLENDCVFSKRLRSGRNKRTSGSDQFDLFRECQGPVTQKLPGLGFFSLSTTPSPTSVAENTPFLTSDINSLEFLYPEQSFHAAPDFLFDVPDASTIVSSDQESHRSEKTTTTVMGTSNSLFDVPIDMTSFPTPIPPNHGASPLVADIGSTPEPQGSSPDGGTPDLMTNLAELLSEIRQYEGQLAQLSGLLNGTFDKYPVGEALFLSQKFCSVLSDCSHHSFFRRARSSFPPYSALTASSEQNLPVVLLALSCYLTLVRVHQSMFEHMYSHLSQIAGSGSRTDSSSINPQTIPLTNTPSPITLEADMRAYRGLQLSQLQPVNREWELARRVKKAVGMLFGLLGHVEKALGLPPDVRIVTIDTTTSLSVNFQGRIARMQSISVPTLSSEAETEAGGGAETTETMFEEGISAVLTGGRLCKTLRERARQLRNRIDEVDDLLKGLLEI